MGGGEYPRTERINCGLHLNEASDIIFIHFLARLMMYLEIFCLLVFCVLRTFLNATLVKRKNGGWQRRQFPHQSISGGIRLLGFVPFCPSLRGFRHRVGIFRRASRVLYLITTVMSRIPKTLIFQPNNSYCVLQNDTLSTAKPVWTNSCSPQRNHFCKYNYYRDNTYLVKVVATKTFFMYTMKLLCN